MSWRSAVVAIGAALLLAQSAGTLRAQECHAKAVHARGQAGLVLATARSRARSAWIKKVRQERQLGPTYAAWLRAKSPTYACHKAGKRTVCVASAIPCRLDTPLATHPR